MTHIAALPTRSVIAITGEDRVTFLQGLVSNDVTGAHSGLAVWAALLTPQGKWLADFFILSDDDRLLLDCEAAQSAALKQRLTRYRLRSRVILSETDLQVYVAWNGTPVMTGIKAHDPRLPDAGWRILSAEAQETNATAADWDAHRLSLGLPDGSRDLEAEKSVLLEAGFDELNGVSWSKGCYMGQELTARTKYRGLVKRRLVPVRIEGAIPPPGASIWKDGVDVGTMRSARNGLGLALLRLNALSTALRCEESIVTPMVPDWMRLPATK